MENGSELVVAGPAPVADTAANISANLDSYETNLPPSITVTDNNPLTVTVGQITSDAAVLAITSNANGSACTLDVVDTAANVSAGLDTLNGDSHVTSIALTDGGTPSLSLTVAQALNDTRALGEIGTPHTITVADTGANISTLTAAQIAGLAAEGVTSIVVTDGVVQQNPFGFELNALQAVALAAAGIHISNPNSSAYYPVIVLDSQANIQALTPAQIAALGGDGVSVIGAYGALVWTVAQTDALISAALSAGTVGAGAVPVVIADTAANVETLTPAQINAARNLEGVTSITVTDGSLTFNVAQALQIEQNGIQIAVPAGDSVTLADTQSNLSTFTAGDLTALQADGFTAFVTINTAPTIAGTVAGQQTTSEAPVNPFAHVTITDANSGATDTLTITLSNGGSGGTLSGSSLSGGSGGVYTLSGTAAAVTSELDALTFTPVAGQPGTSATTTFALSDQSTGYATPVTDSATTVTDADPAVAVRSYTAAQIEALTQSQISALHAEGYASIVSTDTSVALTVAQAIALEGADILVSAPSGSSVGISDTAKDLKTLTAPRSRPAGDSASAGVTSTNASVALTVAQALAFATIGFKIAVPSGDKITITDTAGNVETLTTSSIAGLPAIGVARSARREPA